MEEGGGGGGGKKEKKEEEFQEQLLAVFSGRYWKEIKGKKEDGTNWKFVVCVERRQNDDKFTYRDPVDIVIRYIETPLGKECGFPNDAVISTVRMCEVIKQPSKATLGDVEELVEKMAKENGINTISYPEHWPKTCEKEKTNAHTTTTTTTTTQNAL